MSTGKLNPRKSSKPKVPERVHFEIDDAAATVLEALDRPDLSKVERRAILRRGLEIARRPRKPEKLV